MEVTGWWQVFGLGALGGVLVELLRWYKFADSEELPAYASRPRYWVLTALMVLAGGVLATLYGTGPVHAIAVVNLGASAPALIGAVARSSTGKEVEHNSTTDQDREVPASMRATDEGYDGYSTRTVRKHLKPSLRRFLGFGN